MSIIPSQQNDPLATIDDNHSDESIVKVQLAIDIQSNNSTAVTTTDLPDYQATEVFTCHECINCHLKSISTIRTCPYGINMCYVRLFQYSILYFKCHIL